MPEEQMNVREESCQVVLLSSYNTCDVASEENSYRNKHFAAIVFASM